MLIVCVCVCVCLCVSRECSKGAPRAGEGSWSGDGAVPAEQSSTDIEQHGEVARNTQCRRNEEVWDSGGAGSRGITCGHVGLRGVTCHVTMLHMCAYMYVSPQI